MCPLILPGHCHITSLLIQHYHKQVKHQGRVFTEGALREAGFWIIGGKRRISSVIFQCVQCRKLRGRILTQKMSDLPPERLSMDPPFSFVGLDVFGPWVVTSRRTFVGACKELKMESITDDRKVQEYLSDKGCFWVFNPPTHLTWVEVGSV